VLIRLDEWLFGHLGKGTLPNFFLQVDYSTSKLSVAGVRSYLGLIFRPRWADALGAGGSSKIYPSELHDFNPFEGAQASGPMMGHLPGLILLMPTLQSDDPSVTIEKSSGKLPRTLRITRGTTLTIIWALAVLTATIGWLYAIMRLAWLGVSWLFG
jgi:hypothetical protein